MTFNNSERYGDSRSSSKSESTSERGRGRRRRNGDDDVDIMEGAHDQAAVGRYSHAYIHIFMQSHVTP